MAGEIFQRDVSQSSRHTDRRLRRRQLRGRAFVGRRRTVAHHRRRGLRALFSGGQAWKWLEKYSNVTFHNPPGIQTGDYGDGNCADEHLWAAAELWRTTGDEAFEHYFLEHFGAFRKTVKPNGPP